MTFLWQGVVIGAVLSIITAILSNVFWFWFFERRFRTISIPVFIRAQDAQGGQFALGVTRAMDHAIRHGMADVKGKRVEPVFIDEDGPADDKDKLEALKKLIDDMDPPIVVGPLTSKAANKIVPVIAGQLGIPMILGIPTSTTVLNEANGHAWRLSPTNEKQAEEVVKHYKQVRQAGDRLLVIQDTSDNPDYSNDLIKFVMRELDKIMNGQESPAHEVVAGLSDYAKIDPYFDGRQKKPTTIIYVGMPEAASALVAKAVTREIDATWIFTDGCIPDKQLVTNATQAGSPRKHGKFFVTFQGPPAADSKGLARYIWYVRATGGEVSSFIDTPKGVDCPEDLAASSYEIFGFDSYLAALRVMQDASKSGRVTSKTTYDVLRTNRISDPFLLLGDYRFANGDSQGMKFYVYEISGGCISRWLPNTAVP